jgi:hypothetical protein
MPYLYNSPLYWRKCEQLLFWNILTDMNLGYFSICCMGYRKPASTRLAWAARQSWAAFTRRGSQSYHVFLQAVFLICELLPFYIGSQENSWIIIDGS